jgi:hypothetical protein
MNETLQKKMEAADNDDTKPMRNDGYQAIQNDGTYVVRKPLSPWESYTHALLLSNEAAYVN